MTKDLLHAIRALLKYRGFAAVALLSLGLGIGANTAIFTFINAILLRPIPARDPGRLAFVYARATDSPLFLRNSFLNYRDFRDGNRQFAGLAAFSGFGLTVNMGGKGEAQLVRAQMVSGNYFDVLGVPLRGRSFTRDEGEFAGGPPTVVIGDRFFRDRFGGDPGVLGKTLRINGHDLTIIGITPAGFTGLNTLSPVEIWFPAALSKLLGGETFNGWFESRRLGIFDIVGRLRPGATLAAAQADMQGLAAELARRYPKENKDRGVRLRWAEESTIDPDVRSSYVNGGVMLLAVAGSILMIACANLASLLLTRAVSRRREIAIRIALGASRSRLIRMLLTESVLLSLGGGLLGLLLADWTRDFLWSLRPPNFPDTMDIGLHPRVLLFTLGLSLFTGFLFGLAPALQLSRPNLSPALKADVVPRGSRELRRFSLGNVLVASQVAISMMPLFGAGLFLRSLGNAQHFDPGFQIQNELVLSFDLGAVGYTETQGREFYRRTAEQVQALPGVAAVAMAESLKLYPFGYLMRTVFHAKDRSSGSGELIRTNTVTASYFDTLKIPLLQGRVFSDADGQGPPYVAVVNETMAKHFWPGENVVGKRIWFYGTDDPTEIVGVVKNAKYQSLLEERKPYIYMPLLQSYTSPIYLHVRTRSDPAALLPLVRRKVQSLDPAIGVGATWTLQEVFERNLWAPRLGAALLTGFGILALTLAAIGLYGVITYTVNRRRREIGIRMSLGASRWNVLTLVLKSGMMLVLAGIAAGLLFSLIAGRTVSGYLFGLSGSDPLVLATAALVMGLTALLANLSAARHSTAVSPLEVLKQD